MIIQNLKYKISGFDFDNINIYGLSCGPVDMPYIKCLKNMYPNAKWNISYYDDNEKDRRIKMTDNLLLNKPSFFSLKNDDAKNIEKEIVSRLSIDTYKKYSIAGR